MQEIKVELFIPGELKDEPILCYMIKNFKLDLKIIEASFSTESGWAYLILIGDMKELDKAVEYLRDKGISVEIRDK